MQPSHDDSANSIKAVFKQGDGTGTRAAYLPVTPDIMLVSQAKRQRIGFAWCGVAPTGCHWPRRILLIFHFFNIHPWSTKWPGFYKIHGLTCDGVNWASLFHMLLYIIQRYITQGCIKCITRERKGNGCTRKTKRNLKNLFIHHSNRYKE